MGRIRPLKHQYEANNTKIAMLYGLLREKNTERGEREERRFDEGQGGGAILRFVC